MRAVRHLDRSWPPLSLRFGATLETSGVSHALEVDGQSCSIKCSLCVEQGVGCETSFAFWGCWVTLGVCNVVGEMRGFASPLARVARPGLSAEYRRGLARNMKQQEGEGGG